jgi:hypothetical protein
MNFQNWLTIRIARQESGKNKQRFAYPKCSSSPQLPSGIPVGNSEAEKSWFVIESKVEGRRLTGLMQADIFIRK